LVTKYTTLAVITVCNKTTARATLHRVSGHHSHYLQDRIIQRHLDFASVVRISLARRKAQKMAPTTYEVLKELEREERFAPQT
jgi:hypothetical protein